MTISELNEQEFEKVGLLDEYMKARQQLNAHLALANVCISKAKTTHGVTLFSVNSIDSHDLEPSVKISINKNNFSIASQNTDETEKPLKKRKSGKVEEEKPAKPTVQKGQFRPFGILEPSSAKDARKEMVKALEILCNLATLQQKITENHTKSAEIYASLLTEKELVESIQKFVRIE